MAIGLSGSWSEKVTLVVKLPPEVAAAVRQMEEEDPDFFSRVVLYGATRRGIHRHLKEEAERMEGVPGEDRMDDIYLREQSDECLREQGDE